MRIFAGWLVVSLTTVVSAHAAPAGVASMPQGASRPAPGAAAVFPVIEPLYFPVGGGKEVAAAKQIEFLVQVDRQPYLSESVTVAGGSAAGTVFGLLATRPELRDKLAGLARSGGHQMSVTMRIGGRAIKTVPFRDLVRSATAFPPGPLLYGNLELRLFAPSRTQASPLGKLLSATAASIDPACESYCQSLRSDCIAQGCGTEIICTECEDQYDSCLSSCPQVCTDPKNQYNHEVNTIVGGYQYGYACLCDYYNGPQWYYLDVLTIRHYEYQHTDYCDGHSTDNYLYSWDSTVNCEHPTYSSCSIPSGLTGNVCY